MTPIEPPGVASYRADLALCLAEDVCCANEAEPDDPRTNVTGCAFR